MTSKCPNCGGETESTSRSFKLCKACKARRYKLWADKNRAKLNAYYRNYNKNRREQNDKYLSNGRRDLG